MSFRIVGLEPEDFAHLHLLSDAELGAQGVERVRIDREHVAPCRITLDDAAPGEEVLLLSYRHQPAHTPYRQAGPIFVRAGGARAETIDQIPPALARRTLSLRAYDSEGAMIDADLTEGAQAAALIENMLANANVAYIHAHYARRGCYAARIERA